MIRGLITIIVLFVLLIWQISRVKITTIDASKIKKYLGE